MTGAIDFENPVDNGYDNKYDFTVTYTDSYGKTFAETVQLSVLDDATIDVSTASTTLETSTTGSSDINISKTNTDIAYFDLNTLTIVICSHRALKISSRVMQETMLTH